MLAGDGQLNRIPIPLEPFLELHAANDNGHMRLRAAATARLIQAFDDILTLPNTDPKAA